MLIYIIIAIASIGFLLLFRKTLFKAKRKKVKEAMTDASKSLLEENVPFYKGLSATDKARFGGLTIFIRRQLCILVAPAAVIIPAAWHGSIKISSRGY